MSRILRRPMFRMGGSANSKGTGITSGLERKGYQQAGFVSAEELTPAMEDLQRLQEQFGISYKKPEPEPKWGTSDWLRVAKLGTDILGAEPSKGAAFLSKPASEFLSETTASLEAKKLKQQDIEEKERAYKAGLFETAYGDIAAKKALEREYELKSELEKTKGQFDRSKAFNVEVTDQMIKSINQEIFNLQDQIKAETDPEKLKSLKQELSVAKQRLSKINKGDTAVMDYFLKLDAESGGKFGTLMTQKIQLEFALKELMRDPIKNKEEIDKATQTLSLLESQLDAYASSLSDIQSRLTLTDTSFAKGGRVGLQEGGMTSAQTESSTQMPTYEQLRSRLPMQISDEVVRLISMSPQALADFAEIKTEQDIINFNNTYQTNLPLPGA